MLLIVEGNEGTGKTTLINQLMDKIPFVYVKYPKEVKDTYLMLNNFARSNQLFVLDRSFISDLVYRRLDHKKGQMTLFQIGRLCDENEHRIKIIFCSNKNAFENAMKRGENNITVDSVHKLLDNEFYSIKNIINCFTEIETLDYDYEYDSVDDVLDFLKRGDGYVDRSR